MKDAMSALGATLHQEADGSLGGIAKQIVRALEIADEAMFERLESEGVAHDEHHTAFGLTDEKYAEVNTLAEASPCMREVFEWLQPRGYVGLHKDEDGEYIVVLRRPGEEQEVDAGVVIPRGGQPE